MKTDFNSVENERFLKSLLYLLRETFEGSPESGSAYLDRGVGVFSTIETLSATEVSREVAEMTIAAQTEHAKFYLDRLCEFLGGRTEKVNWEQSWLIETVNETEWDALRAGVRKSYENLLRCLAEVRDWDENKVGRAIGILAHTAYHLGAIRQIVKLAAETEKAAGSE